MIQGSKQEVRKVVPLCINGRKNMEVCPYILNVISADFLTEVKLFGEKLLLLVQISFFKNGSKFLKSTSNR